MNDIEKSNIDKNAGKRVKKSNREIGAEKENEALNYLKKSGYRILEHNFYMRGGESDIIALEGSVLCFVEVKFRKSSKYGTAAEAVTPTKRKRLIKTAQFYLLKHKEYSDKQVRFDVLAIDGTVFTLYKAAFEAY